MNVLVLLKHDEKDQYMIDYIDKVTKGMNDIHFHLLNIVTVGGDVPLQSNGQVLEMCTEFDLSAHKMEAKANQDYLNSLSLELVSEASSLIGDPLRITKDYIRTHQIDLLFTGAHVTSFMEDLLDSSFTGKLLHETNIPYLTIKCDRSLDKLETVYLLRDYYNPGKENLDLVKMIQQKFNSQLVLLKVKTHADHRNLEEIEKKMHDFAEINELHADVLIHTSSSREKGVKEIVKDRNVSILALGQMSHKTGVFSFLNGDVQEDILNHLYCPVLVY